MNLTTQRIIYLAAAWILTNIGFLLLLWRGVSPRVRIEIANDEHEIEVEGPTSDEVIAVLEGYFYTQGKQPEGTNDEPVQGA